MDRPTFSQSWSRVAHLKPVLRTQLQIHRQLFRGEPWFVVHDPINNQFFRLNPIDYHLIGLMDGKRTVDEAWRFTLERYGDDTATQNEVIGLLGQLYQANLLRVDLPPDAQPLLQRRRQRQLRHWSGQAMSILFLRMPLFNPEPILKWLQPLVRPLLSKWGLIAWLGWILFCSYRFVPELSRFVGDIHSVLAPTNWIWLIVLFLLTKAIHELGHGLVCKRFGGVVPEMGVMILVLFPNPFVDATSSWNFSDKWKRLLVAAAGMIVELAVAGGAALVWLSAAPDSLARQISYNMVFLASVTTILFNGNPLLRFDGYYMLSDLLDIPNLYERATRQIRRLVQRYAYGMTQILPVSTTTSEATALLVYGVASQIYRVLILATIILFIAGQLFTLGVLIAIWSMIAWAIVPLGKFVRWLLIDPSLYGHRSRALTVTTAVVLLLIVAIGVIPFEDHRRAMGVVESEQRANLVIQTNGFVRHVLVETGQTVAAGQVILRAENRDLKTRELELMARITGLEALRRQMLDEDYLNMKMTEQHIALRSEQLADLRRQLDDLELRSPQTGVLAAPLLKPLKGQWVQKGQVVGRILDLDTLRVTALVDQSDSAAAFYHQIDQVELRTVGNVKDKIPSQIIEKFDSGRWWLPHPALGYPGGGTIATDPTDPHGRTAARPQFELWLSLPRWTQENDPRQHFAYPGQRVFVRFTLERHRSLAMQWIHRLRQLVRDRLAV